MTKKAPQLAAIFLAYIFASQSRAQQLKTFVDPKSGVTFRYPAQWSSGNDVAFYLGSLILVPTQPGNGPETPQANVGFNATEPGSAYAGTNLNGVQFVYHVAPAAIADDCRKRILAVEDEKSKAVQATINGVTYSHFSSADAGLGHQASREIYGTFQEGRCYMFEEDIHYAGMDNPKSLTAPQLKHLRKHLDAIMQSVRIRAVR